MKRLFFVIVMLSLMVFVSCEDSESLTDGNESTDMRVNDEGIMEVLESDSADLFFDALDDQSEDNFGDEPNWIGSESLDKVHNPHRRFGRIATRPTERSVEIVYDTDSTATAYIHTRLEGKFVAFIADSSNDTLQFIRHEKPMVHEIDRVVKLWKFRDRQDPRLNWRIRNISMAEGVSENNSVQIVKMVVYPSDQDSIVITDPLAFELDGLSLFTFPRWSTVGLKVTVRNSSSDPMFFPEGTQATEIVRLHYGRNRRGHHGRSVMHWAGRDRNGDNVYEGDWTIMQFRGYHHAVVDVIDNGTILSTDERAYPYNSNTWSTAYRVTPF